MSIYVHISVSACFVCKNITKKTTYALKTPRVVALPFIWCRIYDYFKPKKEETNNCHTFVVMVPLALMITLMKQLPLQ